MSCHSLLQFLSDSWAPHISQQAIEALPRNRVVLTARVKPVSHDSIPAESAVAKVLLLEASNLVIVEPHLIAKLLPLGTDFVHKSELLLTVLLVPPLEELQDSWS